MISLQTQLTRIFSDAFEAAGFDRLFGQVVPSNRPDLGQFQCNGALPAAKTLANKTAGKRKSPRDIAQAVVNALADRELFFKEVSLAGPGFINITLTDQFLAAHTQRTAVDDRLGCPPLPQIRTVVVDFGGPNLAKPMHVGHLRSSIIGDSLQRLHRFMGDRVISDIHLGDWGTPMGMLICELRRQQPTMSYFDAGDTGPYPLESPVTITDLQEIYPLAAARCKQDPEAMAAALQATVELQQGRPGYRALWQHFRDISLAELQADFNSLGVTFDHWLGESDYQAELPELLGNLQETGCAQLSDGALIIPIAPQPDGRDIPPLILVKSDGGLLYGATDLATLQQRVQEFEADLILYVVDARQALHFQQLFLAAQQAGLAPANVQLEHVAFGTVNGPDGKPFKTRAGGVMQLKDLISMVTTEALKRIEEAGVARDFDETERLAVAQKVGLAALKFADLMNHRTSDYIFELEKFTRFEGRTGPYLLYTAVRIKSILRNTRTKNLSPGPILPAAGDGERELMLVLAQLPEAIQAAYLSYAPNHLCDFAYNLAQTFNRFYNRHHILGEEDPARQAAWLSLAQLCLSELELILSLLGIEIPERM